MDAGSAAILRQLVQSASVASLGTLRDGGPYVSMVLCAPLPDASGFLIHVSRLAHHTQDLLRDPRASLMLAGVPAEGQDPQTLPRVSIQGVADEIPRPSPMHDAAAQLYVARFPQSAGNLELGDFSFFVIRPREVRFVGGFARAFKLTAERFQEAVTGDGS